MPDRNFLDETQTTEGECRWRYNHSKELGLCSDEGFKGKHWYLYL